MMRRLLLVTVIGILGADWPQWLGPRRDNTAEGKVGVWQEALKAEWRVAVGEGHSSPVVVGDRVYLHTRVKDGDEEQVACHALKTGEEIWSSRYAISAFKSLFGNGPRGTPCVVDGRIYTLGITGVACCLSADKGKLLWQVDLLKKLEARNLLFGTSGSPLVVGDAVLVNVGSGKNGSIVALDRTKGDILWKVGEPASYSSPIVLTQDGKETVLFLTQKGVTALDPKDGTRRWEVAFADKADESSITPARVGERIVVGSITRGCVALEPELRDGKPGVKEVWKNGDLTCYFSTPVAVGSDHLYVVTGVMPPALSISATMHCVEAATGKVLWSRKKVGRFHASLLRVGADRLLLLEDSGDLVLIQHDPKEYKELARAKVCGAVWPHPAFVDGLLIVRDDKELMCLKLPG